MGGSGDYFSIADTVVAMENYAPREVTAEARRIIADRKGARVNEGSGSFEVSLRRVPLSDSVNPRRGRKEKVAARGTDQLIFGRTVVELAAVEQLVDPSQTRAIGELVRYGLRKGYIDGKNSINEILDCVLDDVAKWSLDIISPFAAPGDDAIISSEESTSDETIITASHPGEYALPRRHELAAMLNRMRSLRVEQR
jgi:hypothetical protein